MRSVLIVLSVIFAVALASCEKGSSSKSDYPYVYLSDCVTKEFNSGQVSLCFDQLVSDSRCPMDVVCIWQGTAIAKFSFNENGNQHALTLALQSFPIPEYSSDTTVAGYKIEFVNLYPYPMASKGTPPVNKIHAEMKITKL
jgi:hypothetical protein